MSTTILDVSRMAQVQGGGGPSPDLSGAPLIKVLQDTSAQAPSTQGGLPLLVGDSLAVTAFSNQGGRNITASGRFVNASGTAVPFTQTWEYDTAYTPQTFVMALPQPGTFQSVSLRWDGTQLNNAWMYATAGIANLATGPIPYLQLVADYLSSIGTASWPGRGIKPPTEGSGFSYTLNGGSPGAGNQLTVTVPIGARWDVHWFGFNFTTSSTMADRLISVQALWGLVDGEEWTGAIIPAVPASASVWASFDSYGQDWQNGGIQYRCPLPRPFYLHGCDKIITTISNLDTDNEIVEMLLGITEHYLPDQLSCD